MQKCWVMMADEDINKYQFDWNSIANSEWWGWANWRGESSRMERKTTFRGEYNVYVLRYTGQRGNHACLDAGGYFFLKLDYSLTIHTLFPHLFCLVMISLLFIIAWHIFLV